MKLIKSLVLTICTASTLASCASPSSPNSMDPYYSGAMPEAMASASMSPEGALAQLVNSNVSPEEARLRDVLKRELELKFPLRVGILNYNYRSQLEVEDQQNLFESVKEKWESSEMIREVVQIPDSLTTSGSSVETIRQLAARFQTDVIVLLSGSHQFQEAKSQPLNFFDTFGQTRFFESTVKLEALVFDVFTGTFLSPMSDAKKSDALKLDNTLDDFEEKSYAIKKETETKMWDSLQGKFIKNMAILQQELENKPKASPTPKPDVISSPSPISPTPSVIPGPSSNATPEPVPSAFPSPSPSPIATENQGA